MKYIKSISSVFVFISVILNCQGQELPRILATTKFKKGIYKSFEEFINDSPSVILDFELKKISESKRKWLGGSDFDLILKDSLNTKIDKKSFWGFSTGDSIYVNASNFQSNHGFIKMEALGRYCYFRDRNYGKQRRRVAHSFGLVGHLVTFPNTAVYILNVNNGHFYMLDRDVMTKILTKDSDLLSRYQDEKKKEDPEVMLSYVKEYSLNHTSDIKLRKTN